MEFRGTDETIHHTDNCIFCKIAKGEISSYKIYEDDLVFVFLDNSPDYNGHMLIIPKKHIVDTKDLMQEQGLLEHMIMIAEKMRELIKNTIGTEGFTYLWNMDNAQNVKHFHMHVIPRDKTLKIQPDILPVKDVYNQYFSR